MTGDLEQQLTSFAPPVQPPVLPRADVAYSVDDTPVGRMLFAVGSDGRALASTFVVSPAAEEALLARLAARVSPRVLRQPAATGPLRQQLEEFLAGRRRGFDVPVDLALAGEFQREVLMRLRTTRYGERTTYGALAAALGRPRASRAVGAALGANPLCVVLPCHRVVASSGALTGYAGGLAVKERLLALESSA